jgi:hypothetical protein
MDSIEQIVKKAKEAKDINDLIIVWNDLANNKYNYSLNNIWMVNKEIQNLAMNVKGCDMEKCRFYLSLKGMNGSKELK